MPEEFDHHAEAYEELVYNPVRAGFGGGGSEFFHIRKMDLLLRFLKRRGISPSSLAWLDVGCGRGDLLRLGEPHFRRTAGCDPSAGMLSACKNSEVRVQPSATEVPFDTESFDIVTAVCVYHHVLPALRMELTLEIRRVLKKGGIFVMIEHNSFNPLTRFVVNRIPVDRDAQLLSAPVSRSVQQQAGLTPFRTEYFLFLPKLFYRFLGWTENMVTWLPLGGQYATYARKA
jgi:SAM-dependent methyltransferase